MKKLFAIRNTSTNKLVPNLFFSDKQQAKAKRTELNTTQDSDGKEVLTHVVTYGPDHRKFTN